MKTLVLERRHVLGGAAVTEEVFPGFRFSIFSYVVSLLRPEIIRELELPKHGLDILPLDGTFTPLRPGEGPAAGGGDYLWRVNDHGRTIRELRRWSKNDAEAYEEYGQLMVDMARFIKPILSMVPPDPTPNDPRPLLPLGGLLRSLPEADGAPAGRLRPAHDDVRVRLPGPVVRDGSAQGDDVGVRDHRDVPGDQEPRHRVRPAPPLHGRDRRRVPGLGDPEGRHRRRSRTRSAARPSRRARRSGWRRPSRGSSSGTAGRRASSSRPARRSSPTRSCRRSTAAGRSSTSWSPAPSTPSFEAEVRRFKFRGSSGKVNMALDGLPTSPPAGPGRAPARRGLDSALDRRDGAGLRRRQVRPLEPPAVHRHHLPDPRGSRRWPRRASTS